MELRRLLALAVACGVHAGLWLGVSSVRMAPPPAVEPPVPVLTEIVLEELAPEVASLPSPPTEGPDEAPSARLAIAALPRAERPATPEPAAGQARPEGAPAPSSPVPDQGWSFLPTVARIELRGAVTPDLVAPGRPPTEPAGGTSARPASTTGGVAEALAAHDVELGLGRGGPVLAAAELAARSNDAPLDGGATFDVAVRSDSVVARVVTAEHDVAGWTRVAEALAHTLDPKRMRLPSNGRGWRVVVRVDAAIRLADGRDVKTLHGPKVGVAPSTLQSQLEAKPGGQWAPAPPAGLDDSQDVPPQGGALGRGPQHPAGGASQGLAERALPTSTVSVSGKVCSASLSVTPFGVGLGGACSPENIGTRPMRIVAGHIVSEGIL